VVDQRTEPQSPKSHTCTTEPYSLLLWRGVIKTGKQNFRTGISQQREEKVRKGTAVIQLGDRAVNLKAGFWKTGKKNFKVFFCFCQVFEKSNLITHFEDSTCSSK